jgi:hypothetical protein
VPATLTKSQHQQVRRAVTKPCGHRNNALPAGTYVSASSMPMVPGILPLRLLKPRLRSLPCSPSQDTYNMNGARSLTSAQHTTHVPQCTQAADGAWNRTAQLVVEQVKHPAVFNTPRQKQQGQHAVTRPRAQPNKALHTYDDPIKLPIVLGIVPLSWLPPRSSPLILTSCQCHKINNKSFSRILGHAHSQRKQCTLTTMHSACRSCSEYCRSAGWCQG